MRIVTRTGRAAEDNCGAPTSPDKLELKGWEVTPLGDFEDSTYSRKIRFFSFKKSEGRFPSLFRLKSSRRRFSRVTEISKKKDNLVEAKLRASKPG